ncbi:DUF2513 domain-containing protein [Streptococcus hyovaginalis]|uniref:DUF2513 domain-containing protein n=1 Tax=Streptococcus hyovaginalis TaxID=149015 RepID=UPI003ADF1BC3
MKFDPEIARDILLDVEELHQAPNQLVFSTFEKFVRANKYDLNINIYHCDKLEEAGYLNWRPKYASNKFYLGFINGLSYDGHQFLDSVRDPKIWRETKVRANKLGVFTLNVLAQIALNVISDRINGV